MLVLNVILVQLLYSVAKVIYVQICNNAHACPSKNYGAFAVSEWRLCVHIQNTSSVHKRTHTHTHTLILIKLQKSE